MIQNDSIGINRTKSKSSPKKIRSLDKRYTKDRGNIEIFKFKFNSNKNNCVLKAHDLEKIIPSKKHFTSNNLAIFDENYRKDLFEKYSIFLKEKKFKISNNFDAKNSQKFLENKNKCLERIILSDLIDNKYIQLKMN